MNKNNLKIKLFIQALLLDVSVLLGGYFLSLVFKEKYFNNFTSFIIVAGIGYCVLPNVLQYISNLIKTKVIKQDSILEKTNIFKTIIN